MTMKIDRVHLTLRLLVAGIFLVKVRPGSSYVTWSLLSFIDVVLSWSQCLKTCAPLECPLYSKIVIG